jgi:hypothetical protein
MRAMQKLSGIMRAEMELSAAPCLVFASLKLLTVVDQHEATTGWTRKHTWGHATWCESHHPLHRTLRLRGVYTSMSLIPGSAMPSTTRVISIAVQALTPAKHRHVSPIRTPTELDRRTCPVET